MRLEQRRDRSSRSSLSRSPVPPKSTPSPKIDDDADNFAEARLVKRKTLHQESISRRSSSHTRNGTKINMTDESDPDIKHSHARGNTHRRHSGPDATSRISRTLSSDSPILAPKSGTDAHATVTDAYEALVSRTPDRRSVKQDTYSRRNSSTNQDTLSIKSDGSSQANVRTSGRRTRPSARMSGHTVPHKDPSEADSLSVHSSLDSNNISTNTNSTAETAKSETRTETSRGSRRSDISDERAVAVTREPLNNHDASPKTLNPMTGSPQGNPSSARSSTPTNNQTQIESEHAESIDHTGTTELHALTNGLSRPPLTRTTSASSLSSDLSDLSSISSIESNDSHETLSSTGSNTIKVLQACPDDDEEERQRLVARALALTKKWRTLWHTLDKRVKANVKKQERSRAAREHLAAQKTRRR